MVGLACVIIFFASISVSVAAITRMMTTVGSAPGGNIAAVITISAMTIVATLMVFSVTTSSSA